MARLESLALDGSLPRVGALIKTSVVVIPHHHKMSLNNSLSSGVIRPQLITVKVSIPAGFMWASSVGSVVIKILLERDGKKEENKTAISCFLKSTKECKQGYRKHMYDL